MTEAGEVLEVPDLGIRVILREPAEASAGERLVLEVIGRPRGFITQEHVHARQVERHEVLGGEMNLQIEGRDHLLGAGESMDVPAGTPHRQLPAGDGLGRVRVELRPAGQTELFMRRLEALSRDGRFNRFGLPSPVAAAELVRDFGDEGHATRPPLAVQRALGGSVLALGRRADSLRRPRRRAGSADATGRGPVALARRALERAWREYVFVDEWDVRAPIEAVHDTLADAHTYPDWWRPVYIEVEAEGAPAVGKVSRQHFKGRLPYHLRTRSTLVRLEPPHLIEAEVEGDLRGRGLWTLTPAAGGTHVRFDWRVHADRPLLKLMTPLLRPLLRWNHDWAIARATEGLEPYARRLAAARRSGPAAPASARDGGAASA